MRDIERRPQVCVVCNQKVMISSVTSPHAQAPEMIGLPRGAWMGFVMGDINVEMLVCCSERCVQMLLEEG